jgi:murein DD-endopeptidase MepM/ murein hydrolase activator NlpD
VRGNLGDLRRASAATAATLSIGLVAAAGAFGAGSGGIGPGSGGSGGGAGSDGGVFPVRGPHTYGDGMGAGRDHQGVDVMAKCGRPIVSVYPGKVQTRDYHGAAGNYVVIDGEGKLRDTVYMHLTQPSKLRKRQHVDAGEVIGRVGQTGNASACHLHFEMWSNPGYYEGGQAVDPEPYLRDWDR